MLLQPAGSSDTGSIPEQSTSPRGYWNRSPTWKRVEQVWLSPSTDTIHQIRSDHKRLPGQMLHYLLEKATGVRLEAKKEGEKTGKKIKIQYLLTSRIKGLEKEGGQSICTIYACIRHMFFMSVFLLLSEGRRPPGTWDYADFPTRRCWDSSRDEQVPGHCLTSAQIAKH